MSDSTKTKNLFLFTQIALRDANVELCSRTFINIARAKSILQYYNRLQQTHVGRHWDDTLCFSQWWQEREIKGKPLLGISMLIIEKSNCSNKKTRKDDTKRTGSNSNLVFSRACYHNAQVKPYSQEFRIRQFGCNPIDQKIKDHNYGSQWNWSRSLIN